MRIVLASEAAAVLNNGQRINFVENLHKCLQESKSKYHEERNFVTLAYADIAQEQQGQNNAEEIHENSKS